MKKGQPIVVNGWKLVDKKTGATLQAGVKRKDFRGDSVTVWGGQPPHREGTEGRIQTDKEGFGVAYYASVVDAQWLKNNPSEIIQGKSIQTVYFGPGNTRGARIKASVIDGNKIQRSISVVYPHELDMDSAHLYAAEQMRDKMGWTGDLIGVGSREGFIFGFKTFARKSAVQKNPSRRMRKSVKRALRKVQRYIPLHRVLKGNPVGRTKLKARQFAHGKRARAIAGEVVKGLQQTKHHVCVEMNGQTIMRSKDTPEFRALAKRYAKSLARKRPGAKIKVVAY